MSRVVMVLLVFLCVGSFRRVQAQAVSSPEYFEQSIRPLLKQYCFACHSSEKHKGDFDMERFVSLAEVKRHPKIWQEVADKLANDEMPPEEKPQPLPAEKEKISGWLLAVLEELAQERAGDPGPVVLRRLSNAEYTYTVQDLTGVESLEPAREFPVDGAAGEGFMNTGQALVMSPALISKYLDAAKEIARHAVLLPDGIRFSPKVTRRDWTEEIVTQIRQFYSRFTDPHGGEKVNLQGIVFETNEGGRLPLEKYLAATLAEREALTSRAKDIEAVAREHGLNAKYMRMLFTMLAGSEPVSPLLEAVRARWQQARPDDAAALAQEIELWQKALWKFNTVGHIGKLGGPKSWLEAVDPLVARQDLRIKIPASPGSNEVTLYLTASDAGDGNQDDLVLWEQPRLVAAGHPDLPLRDVRDLTRDFTARRERVFASASRSLDAAAEANAAGGQVDVSVLARRHDVAPDALQAWFEYLGVGQADGGKIDSYFTNHLTKVSSYEFVNGWGTSETPLLVANSSDQAVRIPGNLKVHGVAVHPSPKLQACVGWRCPTAAVMRVEASITHAHPECGNGITWSLEWRRGATRQRLASGTAQGAKEIKVGPFENLPIQTGDLVSVLIGPRNGDHACDLTAVDLVLTSTAQPGQTWNLAADVSPDVLAGNPHADRYGNAAVWHFYTEPDKGGSGIGPVIPADSLLAKWQSASDPAEQHKLAEAVQQLLAAGPPTAKESPDARLYEQLASLRGPLFQGIERKTSAGSEKTGGAAAGDVGANWGLDPAQFGHVPKAPGGATSSSSAGSEGSIGAGSLCVQAPSVIEVRLPAELAAGCEFVTGGRLASQAGPNGSVQLQVLLTKPAAATGLRPGSVTESQAGGPWTSDNRRVSHAMPIVVNDGSQARKRFEKAFTEFREFFPAALCYAKIVPVDEVITLTLFYREDDQLARLMLDDNEKQKLDRLWDQLRYVSQDALTLVDAFEQLWQYATQDADPKVFEPLRKPIQEHAAAFRQRLIQTEPQHVQAVLDLANLAYRRPLGAADQKELRDFYQKLRAQEMPHDEAVRLLLARVLVAPSFLYRAETPGPGRAQVPLSDWELASRLSYFLWSSMPDAELRSAAAAGNLHEPEVLAAQTRRMLRDARVRRLAIEFACQWLHIRDFDTLDEKSERHFPTFAALRGPMYEESIRFFTDLFQRNGSVLEILDADYTFVNGALAKHYGIPGITGEDWQRIEGVKKFSRGGILGEAAVLAKQSGASRTSPILRGNWVAEALLGDKLPKPPKDVPKLPEEETTQNLTIRQLTEKHDTDPRCYHCHQRIDAFGFALESFDAIGRFRARDSGERPIETHVKVMDGTEFEGIDGLRQYLLTKKRDAFLRQFSRKLLGYALGRSVQLSDEPLLKAMVATLQANNQRIAPLIETIVQSRQFREIRGTEIAEQE